MIRRALAAFGAAILMFMWGFVFWASGAIDPFTHLSSEGETAITEALRANAPQHGLYAIPDTKGDQATAAQRMAQGPFALLFVQPAGAQMADPKVMGVGFLHMFVTAFLIGLLLTWVLPATPTWMDRFKVVALMGVTAAFFVHLGNPIWWHYPVGASLLFAVYDLGSYLIAGAVMAWAIRA